MIKPDGDVDYLMVCHFPDELLMQVDLRNGGYRWYAYAYDNRSLLTIATVTDTTVTDPVSGFAESLVLQP